LLTDMYYVCLQHTTVHVVKCLVSYFEFLFDVNDGRLY
jgi:hypothetical protein